MAVLTADSRPAGRGLPVDTAPVSTALLDRPALNIRTLAEMRITTGPTVFNLWAQWPSPYAEAQLVGQSTARAW